MPPKTKNVKVTKKGKLAKKRIPCAVPDHSDMDWTSGDEEGASIKSLLTNMSTMLTALTSRVDGHDPATGHPGRTVESQGVPPSPPAASTSQERAEPLPVEMLAPPFTNLSEEVRAKMAQ